MPEDMTPAAVTSRVSAFVEADWRTKAEQLMRESKEKGKNLIVRHQPEPQFDADP